MNVCELINEVGVENVKVQFLDSCADDLQWSEKSGTRIKFGTEVGLTPNGTVMCGMVVWMPRDAVAAATAKAKAGKL